MNDQRVWRLRKRHQHIDAVISRGGDRRVLLEFVVNGRHVPAGRWATRAQAIAAATERRHDLERAGWSTHW